MIDVSARARETNRGSFGRRNAPAKLSPLPSSPGRGLIFFTLPRPPGIGAIARSPLRGHGDDYEEARSRRSVLPSIIFRHYISSRQEFPVKYLLGAVWTVLLHLSFPLSRERVTSFVVVVVARARARAFRHARSTKFDCVIYLSYVFYRSDSSRRFETCRFERERRKKRRKNADKRCAKCFFSDGN